jgi:cytochrome bd ubiquinol oxidase subunit I
MLAFATELVGQLGRGDQQDLLWARELQAMSFAVHIPLVCFGVAFPAIVLFTEWLGQRTGNETYTRLARRWSKVMATLFAVGVVTGTILSFELGILWPDFMATFGQVFGLAFALEGFSFFAEGIFVAIYVYGWDRLSPRAHLASGIPAAIAGFTGSMMVIAVNGWMNHPTGFSVVDGKVTDVHPWQAIFNPFFWHEMTHMYVAGFMVSGFLVAGVYAWAWMKGRRDHYTRAGLVIALSVAALASPVQVLIGDWAGREVAKMQPVKLAALEGLGQTQRGAPFHLGGFYSDGEVKAGIRIPKLLSLLARHDPTAEIQGLEAVPPDDRPPVNVVRTAFQVMVGVGTLLALLGVLYVATWWRKRRLPRSVWFWRAVVAAGPAATLALLCGWVVTEVGRQPFVVYHVLRTREAVTDAGGLPVAFFAMLVVYASLAAMVVWLLRRLSRERESR